MGLNFDRPQAGVQTAVLEAENGVEVVEKYDIVEYGAYGFPGGGRAGQPDRGL